MKKLLALILALLMLCACGAEEETIDNPQNEELNVVSEVSYLGENGKYGFHKEGVPVTEAIFDEIVTAKDIYGAMTYTYEIDYENYLGTEIFAGIITEGIRAKYETDWETGAFLSEEPNSEYILFDKNSAKIINSEPLSNFYFLSPQGFKNSTDSWIITGTHNGDLFEFFLDGNGGWKLGTKISGGIKYCEENYNVTQYYWSPFCLKYGMEDKEGSTILEPVYRNVPECFGEYFLVSEGDGNSAMEDILRTSIFDIEGNLICGDFSYIDFECVEDGKYSGGVYEEGKYIAKAAVYENGNYFWWFIGKKGEKLSEKFESISLNIYRDEKGRKRCETANVIVNGEEKEIRIDEYVLDLE
ncbi:MAG: hypothetical protein IJB66_05365 [Oscillospiraceae bacterium]|nr:hypothetical protein [Oscillospiraceae bacterium]